MPVLFSLTEGFNVKVNALELQDDLVNTCQKVVIQLRNVKHCPWDSKEEKCSTVINQAQWPVIDNRFEHEISQLWSKNVDTMWQKQKNKADGGNWNCKYNLLVDKKRNTEIESNKTTPHYGKS
jgi:hypothetical protein